MEGPRRAGEAGRPFTAADAANPEHAGIEGARRSEAGQDAFDTRSADAAHPGQTKKAPTWAEVNQMVREAGQIGTNEALGRMLEEVAPHLTPEFLNQQDESPLLQLKGSLLFAQERAAQQSWVPRFAARYFSPHMDTLSELASKIDPAVEHAQQVNREYDGHVTKFVDDLKSAGVGPEILRDLPYLIRSGNLTLRSPIPIPDSIGNLTRLKRVDLSHTNQTRLPDSIGKLTNLEALHLVGNALTQLPDAIANLRNLQTLDLQGNRLSQLPDAVGSLEALRHLELTDNQLTQLPEALGRLRNLQSLSVNSNQLTSLPDSIGNLQNLQDLWLNNNQLGQIPDSIGRLSHVRSLDLGRNRLVQLPDSITGLNNLQSLPLHENQLTSLPSNIGNLQKLTTLNVHSNRLTQLPDSIGQSNVSELQISNNRLSQLPDSIGSMRNLRTLNADGNALTQLPESIGNLRFLTTLGISNNALLQLPDAIGNLPRIVRMDASNNRLTQVPASISNLANLVNFNLLRNPIAAAGDDRALGRVELRRRLGDRVMLDDLSAAALMPRSTTKEDVYSDLDARPVRIQRDNFRATRLPEIPTEAAQSGEEFLEEFGKLYSNLNFSNERDPGYLSYDLLSGGYGAPAGAEAKSNAEKVHDHLLPRLTGYFKTLYGLPIDEGIGEQPGWQMYDEQKPAMKKALTHILKTLNELPDPDQRASLFTQFVHGMLYCPTGQKEGIDTVIKALLEGKTERSSNLRAQVQDLVATKKNSAFRTAVLTRAAENTQNVHMIAHYEDLLKDELGLSNVLGFRERIGMDPRGRDPFNGNPFNVLKTYYDLVTPQRLTSWLMERTPSSEDMAQRTELAKMQKSVEAGSGQSDLLLNVLRQQLERATDPAQKTRLQDQIAAREHAAPKPMSKEERKARNQQISETKAKVRLSEQFKPLEPLKIMEYLLSEKLADPEKEDWWKGYFTGDPELSDDAALTSQGALKLLQHLGYVTVA